jgi:unsaturated chondroitin disaccharide hydrolase
VIDTTLEWATVAQEQAEAKLYALAKRVGGAFLHATTHGGYITHTPDEWTSGFWPGLLLLAYQQKGTTRLLEHAIEAEATLEQAVCSEYLYGLHHDVGFQFSPTAVMRYRLTGDPAARRRGFLAANLLMGRFNPSGGFIEAWNTDDRRGMVIIDSMMNLPLLYWAAHEFNQPRFRNVADSHARLALRHFVRPDGQTHHVLRFDQVEGTLIDARGGQGYAPFSCWSRGQAWALYGFSLAYRYTSDAAYLAVARRVADCFLAALPNQEVPPWDFGVPEPTTAPRDSSAGAIAASGLLELAALLPPTEGEPFRRAAVRLLHALYTHCGTHDHEREEGLLRHATGNHPKGLNIDVSLIYGDYFYFEALGKLNGDLETCW